MRGGGALAERVADIAPIDWDEESFRATVSANLRDGRFRLVFAVDQITDELGRIVRYLNAHTNPEVRILALELGYVSHEGVEILMPTVFGIEGTQEKASVTVSGTKWNEASFFAAVATAATSLGIDAIRRLFTFSRGHDATMVWGNGPLPSVSAYLPVGGKPTNIFSIDEWLRGKAGVSINFEYFAATAPSSSLEGLATALRAVTSFAPKLVDLESTGYKKRPRLLVDDELCQVGVMSQIEAALERFLTDANPQSI